MLRMVAAEGHGAGDAGGDVAQHGHDLVEGHVATSAVVSEVMDAAVESMVEEAAD